jgi:tryptophan-rich sensory protein
MLHAGGSMEPDAPMPPVRRAMAAVLPVALAALLATLATRPNIPTWYAGLAKPGFTPPNWVFGPVWTILYVMMAAAAWRILSLPQARPGRRAALTAFFVQLALNAAWSFAFFAAHSPGTGLAVIGALMAAILWTIRLFWPLDRGAAWLLVPYAAWVAYAAALNASIWRLNG